MAQNDLVVPILANNSLFSTKCKLARFTTEPYGQPNQVSGRVWLRVVTGTCRHALIELERAGSGFYTVRHLQYTRFTAPAKLVMVSVPETRFWVRMTRLSPHVRAAMLGLTD